MKGSNVKRKYRIPGVARLRAVFGDNARKARKVLEMTRAQLIETDAGDKRVRECHNPPETWDIRMHVLNAMEDSNGGWFFGLETVALGNGELVEYLNTGDTYAATVYRWRGNYHVGSWGDLVERHGSMDLQDALLRRNRY